MPKAIYTIIELVVCSIETFGSKKESGWLRWCCLKSFFIYLYLYLTLRTTKLRFLINEVLVNWFLFWTFPIYKKREKGASYIWQRSFTYLFLKSISNLHFFTICLQYKHPTLILFLLLIFFILQSKVLVVEHPQPNRTIDN